MMRVTPPCWAESHHVLSTCDQATPHSLIAWAVGVKQFTHAIDLRRPQPPYASGRNLDNGRWYRGHETRGWSISGTLDGDIIARGKWSEIAGLMHYDQLPASLRAQIERAWATRRARTPPLRPDRGRDWHTTPEAQHERAMWAAIELRCYALAHLAWCHWRLADADLFVQLDLFAEVAHA